MTCSAEQSSDQSKEKTEMPKLDKILYLQAGRCFYCGKILSRKKAFIDHMQPISRGGTNAEWNLVACCKTINQYFGDISLKEKIAFIIKAKEIKCPEDIIQAQQQKNNTKR